MKAVARKFEKNGAFATIRTTSLRSRRRHPPQEPWPFLAQFRGACTPSNRSAFSLVAFRFGARDRYGASGSPPAVPGETPFCEVRVGPYPMSCSVFSGSDGLR